MAAARMAVTMAATHSNRALNGRAVRPSWRGAGGRGAVPFAEGIVTVGLSAGGGTARDPAGADCSGGSASGAAAFGTDGGMGPGDGCDGIFAGSLDGEPLADAAFGGAGGAMGPRDGGGTGGAPGAGPARA